MTRIIYSTQRRGFEPGEIYQNPRYFGGIDKDATEVVVIGDWPNVVAAYEAAKIPVISDYVGKKPKRLPEAEDDDADETEGVELPDNWRKASFKKLRQWVKKFDADKEVTTREQAIEFIEAHLEPEE